jgi:hypothetical protein
MTKTKISPASTRRSVLAILDCGKLEGMHSMFVDPAHKRALALLERDGIAKIVRRQAGAWYARLA